MESGIIAFFLFIIIYFMAVIMVGFSMLLWMILDCLATKRTNYKDEE